MQDFFPIGFYGGDAGDWTPFGIQSKQFNREYNKLRTDIQAELGANIIWGGATQRSVVNRKNLKLYLNAYGKWFYGVELPFKEMMVLPSLIEWTRYKNVRKKFIRNSPPLSKKELALLEEDKLGVLKFAAQLKKDYPETIPAFISDDEPSKAAIATAVAKLIEKYTGVPATTCSPDWGNFTLNIPNFQPIAGDWYVTGDLTRDMWVMQKRMHWIHNNYPDKIFWFMPLAGAYEGCHEITKTWLRDSRPSPAEFRMQLWSMTALGSKGVFPYNIQSSMPMFMYGEDHVLDAALRVNNGIAEEFKKFAIMISSIGPLFLKCKPLKKVKFAVTSGKVSYPEYKGKAISYGLLKDIRLDRTYLIPWNQSVTSSSKGSIKIPKGFLEKRKVYDLLTLKEVKLFPDDMLTLKLKPGAGNIFLIATYSEFQKCKNLIDKNSIRYYRVISKMHYRIASAIKGIDLTKSSNLINAASTDEKNQKWADARRKYQKALVAITSAENNFPEVKKTREAINRLGATVSETEDIFNTHMVLLKLPKSTFPETNSANKICGPQFTKFWRLVREYIKLVFKTRNGKYDGTFDKAIALGDEARENLNNLNKIIKKRLDKVRAKICIAYITPDRYDTEYNMLMSFLYESAETEWFVPNNKGILTNIKGKEFSFNKFDVIYIQQLVGKKLIPQITSQKFINDFKKYLKNGGGLVLSNLSARYITDLGIEKNQPSLIVENSFFKTAGAVGIIATKGNKEHPIFKATPKGGFLTNGNFPGQNLIAFCEWGKYSPIGKIIASEYNSTYGALNKPAVIEYNFERGKIVTINGRYCDFTPGVAHGEKVDRHELKRRTRAILLNALKYCAKNAPPFEQAKNHSLTSSNTKKIDYIELPLDNWKFKTDPNNIGMKDKWYAPSSSIDGWKKINIGTNWESQGFESYDGYAWYRKIVTMSNKKGRKTFMNFGAVDETAVVFIDGRFVNKHNIGLKGWNRPFKMDITGFLTPKSKKYEIVVQVHDKAGAGGIWKPIFLTFETKK
jgi:hypothetical protein